MNPFLAEIRIFAGNFPPRGWAFCNGQILSIAQNTALFSLLGTTYGGNGQTTFALPDLRGRSSMHWGQGPGLTERVLGEMAGENNVTLLTTEIPAHVHDGTAQFTNARIRCSNGSATSKTAEGNVPAVVSKGHIYNGAATSSMAMGVNVNQSVVSGPNTGSQPHNNMQPYLGLTFIIALQGIFPPRG